jgi:hypothetical protein
MSIEWDEPTPGFYISELARNTIVYHYAISGKQNFSKKPQGDCVVPVYFTPPSKLPVDGNMNAARAAYFMRRFKHEEKMLGPNEQAALDYVINMLEEPA